MKCFILVAIVCATIGFSEQAITKEQAIEHFKKHATDCAAKEGASAADLEEAFARKIPPSTKPGLCIHACIAETVGVIKDNKLSIDGHLAMAKMIFDDPARIQMAKEIGDECANVTDADRCEAALKIIQCCEKAAKSRGISIDDW